MGSIPGAKALHAELGNLKLIETNGETVNNKLELFAILINADESTTIFIDEAQGMNSRAQHILLTALSEGNLYVPRPHIFNVLPYPYGLPNLR